MEMGKMLKIGVIKLTETEWATFKVGTPRRDGTLRSWEHYRRFSIVNVRNSYVLAIIDVWLNSQGNSLTICLFDANRRKWNFETEDTESDKTAFDLHHRSCRLVKILFAQWKSPRILYRSLAVILSFLQGQIVPVYLDDVTELLRNADEHMLYVRAGLSLIHKATPTLRSKRREFFNEKIDFRRV